MGSHCGRLVFHSEILGCEEHVVNSKTKFQSVQLGKTSIFKAKYLFGRDTVSANLLSRLSLTSTKTCPRASLILV